VGRGSGERRGVGNQGRLRRDEEVVLGGGFGCSGSGSERAGFQGDVSRTAEEGEGKMSVDVRYCNRMGGEK
jgi:hypothetical protein